DKEKGRLELRSSLGCQISLSLHRKRCLVFPAASLASCFLFALSTPLLFSLRLCVTDLQKSQSGCGVGSRKAPSSCSRSSAGPDSSSVTARPVAGRTPSQRRVSAPTDAARVGNVASEPGAADDSGPRRTT